MAQKILGLDLGTSSIGVALRNIELGNELEDQLEYYSVDIFQSGIGQNKSGEFSFAAERTKHRQTRRLYETHRRRLWATLQLLIDEKLCPMKQESLDQWETYDKSKGLTRKYPVDDLAFDAWIKLDFDGDGNPDYSSPYQIRRELVTTILDFDNQENRYKLGRALYHIAQRRGFKSSKGETIAEQEKNDSDETTTIEDISAVMQASEFKRSQGMRDYMEAHDCKTIGQALAIMEDEGERLRNVHVGLLVRSQYEDEIREIFKFQPELSTDSNLFHRLLSKKKGEGTIFYKKPLKSQRGNVGKCTLEKNKPRCPIAHPEFEKFRAWTLLNNIKYRETANATYQTLPFDLKQEIYNRLFVSRVKSDFQFKEIRELIQKELNINLVSDEKHRLINYRDNQSITASPVTARIVKMLGDDWENWTQTGTKQRLSHNGKGELHTVQYTAMDLWHFCYDAEDPEDVKDFAINQLGWDEDKAKLLTRLWSAIPQGYAMLSLKAIRRINYMLMKGLIYSDAVFLESIPEDEIDSIIDDYHEILAVVNTQKLIIGIANTLIAHYKSLPEFERFAYKDFSYKLQESDHNDILLAIKDEIGSEEWALMSEDEQMPIIDGVNNLYQSFFADINRKFIETPTIYKEFYIMMQEKHPSLAHLYEPSKVKQNSLGDPNIGGIKNPVVLRTLHHLKRKVNAMLEKNLITPEDTRVVVETARDFNDSNMRWAINAYQREQEKERKEIAKILKEFDNGHEVTESDIDKARYVIEQSDENNIDFKKKRFAINVIKYKLWLDQGCQCMYTGKTINLSNLLSEDSNCDIEHTIPRSISFDSSDANLTVCDSYYNRNIKKNQLPTQLANYEQDVTINGVTYTAIKPRLEKWQQKVKQLRNNVEFWKAQSRKAMDKGRKDDCVRQKHLWQMHYDYWRAKLERFMMTEVKAGFRNSQLVDTRIITKYAAQYLKTVFPHVDVQKGMVTATFRKIMAVQPANEEKDRSNHFHHALDATMLTLVPVAAKRESMLKLFYEIQDAKSHGHDCTPAKDRLKHYVDDCHAGNHVANIAKFIEDNILVLHHSKDQTFAPARKRVRVRGKEVKVMNNNGEMVTKWSDGDSIRGRLHEETYFGAIKYPKESSKTIERTPLRENGKFIYDEKDELTIVARFDIKDGNKFSSLKDFDKIIDPRLRMMIYEIISKRMKSGMSFTNAIAEDIWMIDQNGKEIKQDKNGRPLRPIRHVRCKVIGGRGEYRKFSSTIPIKKRTNKSQKSLKYINNCDYKQFTYAGNDTNYVYLIYEKSINGKLLNANKIINLFEISKSHLIRNKISVDEYIKNYYGTMTDKKGNVLPLVHIVRVGTKVLDFRTKQEACDFIHDSKELNKRLYTVKNFDKKGNNYINLTLHSNAETGKKANDIIITGNRLFEHDDFEIDELGNIILLND